MEAEEEEDGLDRARNAGSVICFVPVQSWLNRMCSEKRERGTVGGGYIFYLRNLKTFI